METNRIYNADCLELMAKMPNEFIDLTVTSPPYNVGIDYDNYNDNKSEQDYWQFTESWLKELSRVTKIGGRIYINIPVMGNNSEMKKRNNYLFHLPQYLSIIRKCFSLREMIIWIKSYAEYDENIFCGGSTTWGSWQSPSNPFCRSFSEFIIVSHKLMSRLQHNGKTDLTKEEFLKYTKNIWFLPTETNRIGHPAPFPYELPFRCIKLYSYINDLIFDPFVGSGTTCLVARDLHRNYIGCDVSKKYIEIANGRLSQQRIF